jgi:methylenetetrahydrofolate dehydrogenase (NADP+)/methenyltetrahydrofolate cyclohydrolase
MPNIILDGKTLAQQLNERLKTQISTANQQYGRTPILATILVGDDPASQVYISMKGKTCASVGIQSIHKTFPHDVSMPVLREYIHTLNTNSNCDGILIQMPLPPELRPFEPEIMQLIDPEKDVDGLHPQSIGLCTFGDESTAPCTPKGMIRLLEEYHIPIDHQEVVIVNRTNVIGKPLAMMFLNRHATVTVCHTHTRDLSFHLKRADIIVVGVGKQNFITPDRIKDQVTIIDAGINRDAEGKLVGDVAFTKVLPKCAAITPVPGGVGPMTIAMLMENTYLSFVRHARKK